jgi:transcriptional regulator with XRE-family HTH domain
MNGAYSRAAQGDRTALAKEIGANIRSMRRHRGMSAFKLAARGGYESESGQLSIERGTHMPSIERLYRIAAALDCSVHDILPVIAPHERKT